MMIMVMMMVTMATTIVKMTDQWKDLDTLLFIRSVTDTYFNRPSSTPGLRIEKKKAQQLCYVTNEGPSASYLSSAQKEVTSA